MSGHADRFTVVLDTNVLVGALTRKMLLSLAEDGLFRARWSQTTLHQKFERTFIKLYGDGDIAARQRGNIEKAFPEGLVIEDPEVMASLILPDPDDRHVLAAAIQTKAALIITQNLKDFPSENLLLHEIEAISTDDFLGSSCKCNTAALLGIGCCDGQTKQAPQQRGTRRDFGRGSARQQSAGDRRASGPRGEHDLS